MRLKTVGPPDPVDRRRVVPSSAARARCTDVQKQLDETRRHQERLLNLHISGNLDEVAFATKNTELRDRHATLKLELEIADRGAAENVDKALRVFELSQALPEKWVKSDYTEKRQIIEMVCLNLVLKGTSLCIATRKPFNALVERLKITGSGDDETPIELFLAGVAENAELLRAAVALNFPHDTILQNRDST